MLKEKVLALLLTFLKTFGYAACGVVGQFLLMMIPAFQPIDPTQAMIWRMFLAAALTGLAKVLIRISTWDPEKLGK